VLSSLADFAAEKPAKVYRPGMAARWPRRSDGRVSQTDSTPGAKAPATREGLGELVRDFGRYPVRIISLNGGHAALSISCHIALTSAA
jgi:hypothetical protein